MQQELSNFPVNIPFDILWGVDVAIKKLRPGAHFQLEGTNITYWNDPNNTEPPTWDEVKDQMEKDRAVYEQWMKDNNFTVNYR